MTTRRLPWYLALVAALMLTSGVAFAGDAPPAEDAPPEKVEEEAPKEAAPADNASLAGTWMSEWGQVTINVNGNKFDGSWSGGAFEGEIDAKGVLHYTWTQPDGEGGKGTFVRTGEKLVGRWGYKVSSNNGGDWSLWREAK